MKDIKILMCNLSDIKNLAKGINEVFSNEFEEVSILRPNLDGDEVVFISDMHGLSEITNKDDFEAIEEVVKMSLRPELYDDKVSIEKYVQYSAEGRFRVSCELDYAESKISYEVCDYDNGDDE